jgi:hypothetical protein
LDQVRLPNAEQRANRVDDITCDDTILDGDCRIGFSFLPPDLRSQCRSLIDSYHGLHGYGCLPDILWKAGLGPFIETHLEFRRLLRKASTTRSAKKSSEGFARIATTLLSLEILASNFAGWGAIHLRAASAAKSILKRKASRFQTPLMESYLYPPKHLRLILPIKHQTAETGSRF